MVNPMKAVAILGVLVAAAAVVPVLAQDTRPTFRTGVDAVPITVVVRNARNAIVRDLTREDFEVLENGVPRPIVSFSSTDDASVSVGLLFDTSGSMRGRTLDSGKQVVDVVLEALDRDADEVSLFTFDTAVQQQTPFTNDAQTVRRAVDGIATWGLTSLYDGIADTAKRVQARPTDRRAVVVITDGLDTSSRLTPPEVSGLASAIDVPVYVLVVAPPSRTGVGGQAVRDYELASLAYWTGGDVLHVPEDETAAKAVERLMTELRQQYALTIESATEPGWQRLEVRTRRKGLNVRARIGYFARRAAGE
jgi:Ca-activated chloride channel homolog